MGWLDPRLKLLLRLHAENELEGMSPGQRRVWGIVQDTTDVARVFIEYRLDRFDSIQAAGFELSEPNTAPVHTGIDSVLAIGTIPLDGLQTLADTDGVSVWGSRPLFPKLNASLNALRIDDIHDRAWIYGEDVIVGFVDSGIDYSHPNFSMKDTDDTRIAFIRDYFTNKEHNSQEINASLSVGPALPHVDEIGHGTMIAGIAAGNGKAPGSQQEPLGSLSGVAPAAGIIMVKGVWSEPDPFSGFPLATDTQVWEGIDYILCKAGDLPVVVNLSIGSNLGPHDGTAPLEKFLDDRFSRQHRRAVVCAAGNSGHGLRHASGTVPENQVSIDIQFEVPEGDGKQDVLNVWFPDDCDFEAKITSPSGRTTGWKYEDDSFEDFGMPGPPGDAGDAGGVWIFTDSNAPWGENSNEIQIYVFAHAGGIIKEGIWTLSLRTHGASPGGPFDVWIEREFGTDDKAPTFQSHNAAKKTIHTPANGHNVIVVGSYVTRSPDDRPQLGVGAIDPDSSQGPTRDGRLNPSVVAPGMVITTTQSVAQSAEKYVGVAGTSFAAPHVAGTVALMFEVEERIRTSKVTIAWPWLTQQSIKHILSCTSTAPAKSPGVLPDNLWGGGIVNPIDALDVVATIP